MAWEATFPAVLGGATKLTDLRKTWDNILIGRNPTSGIIESIDAGGGVIAGDSVIEDLAAGKYTPVLTNGVNVASSIAHVCRYIRVNNIVTVSGSVTIDATAASTVTALTMTLPIASAFTDADECNGAALVALQLPSESGAIGIGADVIAAEVQFGYKSGTSVTAKLYNFIFNYEII